MEFLITDTEKDGVRLAKVATPSSNRSFLNSCKGWAGKVAHYQRQERQSLLN